MSGNLWMFSDKLDDEDIEIMKHEFITYYQGADYYGLGLKIHQIGSRSRRCLQDRQEGTNPPYYL